MTTSRFSEGFILGAIVGIAGAYMMSSCLETSCKEIAEEVDGDAAQSKNESKVSKTLESIEKGLDRLSQMVDSQKNKDS